MLGTTFYHNTTEDYLKAFGDLFNDISIRRFASDGSVSKTIEVPISFSPKEPFIRRLSERSSISDDSNAKVKRTLPRMGYEVLAPTFDPERMINPLQKIMIEDPQDPDNVKWQFSPSPYNFNFQLFIAARNLRDAYQIVEQIMPYFQPSFPLSVNLTDLNYKITLPLTLESSDPDIEYEGNFEGTRIIIWSLSFELKGWIFKPTNETGVIKEIDIYNRDLENCGTLSSINTTIDPLNSSITDEFNTVTTVTVNE